MRICPHYEKDITLIDEITIPEIDTMIEQLKELKKQAVQTTHYYKDAVEKYNNSGGTAIGVTGYYPVDKPSCGSVGFVYYDHWLNKSITMQMRTKSANKVNTDQTSSTREFEIDLDFSDINKEPNTYICRTITAGEIKTNGEAPNLRKAEKILQLADKNKETIYVGIDRSPLGGVFVGEAIGRFYIANHTMSGIKFKEVSQQFYDAFILEFKEGDEV